MPCIGNVEAVAGEHQRRVHVERGIDAQAEVGVLAERQGLDAAVAHQRQARSALVDLPRLEARPAGRNWPVHAGSRPALRHTVRDVLRRALVAGAVRCRGLRAQSSARNSTCVHQPRRRQPAPIASCARGDGDRSRERRGDARAAVIADPRDTPLALQHRDAGRRVRPDARRRRRRRRGRGRANSASILGSQLRLRSTSRRWYMNGSSLTSWQHEAFDGRQIAGLPRVGDLLNAGLLACRAPSAIRRESDPAGSWSCRRIARSDTRWSRGPGRLAFGLRAIVEVLVEPERRVETGLLPLDRHQRHRQEPRLELLQRRGGMPRLPTRGSPAPSSPATRPCRASGRPAACRAPAARTACSATASPRGRLPRRAGRCP